MTDDLTKALRQRAAATHQLAAEIDRRERAETRLTILERTLIDVWRWTNDGHPHLELLLPILRQADGDIALIVALENLEGVNG